MSVSKTFMKAFQPFFLSFQELSAHSPELRELSSTDLKFLEEGLEGGGNALCDLDTILDGFQADNNILLTNPDRLLDGELLHFNLF